MKNFTGLNPKIYAYQTNTNKETRKTKGVSKMVLQRDTNIFYYDHVLDTGESITRYVYAIRSLEHKVYTIETKKRSA